jgi:hypothetical protein
MHCLSGSVYLLDHSAASSQKLVGSAMVLRFVSQPSMQSCTFSCTGDCAGVLSFCVCLLMLPSCLLRAGLGTSQARLQCYSQRAKQHSANGRNISSSRYGFFTLCAIPAGALLEKFLIPPMLTSVPFCAGLGGIYMLLALPA